VTPDRFLDGNAVAGALYEIFGREMTDESGACLDCGAVNRFGALIVYVSSPGHVLRCPDCGAVLLVIVVEPDGYHVTVESLQATGI
jgi:uncharacterized Zn finger protein